MVYLFIVSRATVECYLFGGSGDIVTATGRHNSMVPVSAVGVTLGKHGVDGHR